MFQHARKHILSKLGAQTLRATKDIYTKSPYQYLDYNCQVYRHAGWHFSYLGDSEFIKTKFVSFSHASELLEEYVRTYNVNNELDPNSTERFFVKIDDYFPKTVLRNIDKYQQYIAPDAIIDIKDLFSNL